MAAVRAIGVTKRFESTCALDGVDLTVAQGEVRGLLGPNGAGKTTLLRILFGLVAADSGSIELFDTAVGGPDGFRLEDVAGFVEDPTFYPYLSGRGNLELLAELDGGSARDRVGEVLERVGLTPRGGDRVSGYSSGMRQRLGIAASLLRAPRLLLLDEPTSGLDPAGVHQIGSLVQELSAGGVAVILSSHQIGEIEGICDSFTFLRSGRVVWDGTAEQLSAQAPSSAYKLQTSDDPRALAIAKRHPQVRATAGPHGGLTVTAREADLDPFVLELGTARVAVRRLELTVSPLESMFFALTGESPADPEAVTELPDHVLTAS